MSSCEAALCGTIIKRVSYQALSVVAQRLPPSELPVDVGALSPFPPSARPAVPPTLIYQPVYFADTLSAFHSLGGVYRSGLTAAATWRHRRILYCGHGVFIFSRAREREKCWVSKCVEERMCARLGCSFLRFKFGVSWTFLSFIVYPQACGSVVRQLNYDHFLHSLIMLC